MNKIEEYILSIYDKLPEGESQPISEDSVKDAICYIDDFEIKDSKSLFTIVAALNLLNAYVKIDKLKSSLYYSYIKTNVSKVADYYLSNIDKFEEAAVYYEKERKCFFFDIFGVVFSFHQIKETNNIVNVASNYEPIIWPGIRLQRIAQLVFEYGEQMESLEKSDDTITKTQLSIEKPKTSLTPCPDCGKMMSNSAKTCPNCGFDNSKDDEIVQDVSSGDSVFISYCENEVSGVVKRFGKTYLEISKGDGAWVRIRYNAIDSIEKHDNANAFVKKIQSADSFIQQIENNIKNILNIEGIDRKELISTNSTITQGGTGPFTVIMDNGKTVTCTKQGNITVSKKAFLNNDIIGKRVFCGDLSADGKCRCTIVEMSYLSLLRLIEKGVTKKGSKARSVLFAVITYLNKFVTKPEAYLELKEFEKNAEFFFGKFDVATDFSDESEPSNDDSVDSVDTNQQETNSNSLPRVELYRTETEKALLSHEYPRPKVLGKIDLDSIYGKKSIQTSALSKTSNSNIIVEKPIILSSEKTVAFLNQKLNNLSEIQCKSLEKELDSLIREGKKEECLNRSYQIISTRRPTPKYLRSYLDRIVNTEIALDHTEEALQSLAYLIAYSEQQGESNESTLAHWYITMARLYVKLGDKEEANKAVQYASKLKPNNSMVNKLMVAIQNMEKTDDESNRDAETGGVDNEIAKNSIGKMLLQDVEQEAHRQELLPSEETVPAEQLLMEAQKSKENPSKSYEEKASLYLETAAAYYNSNQVGANIFKTCVAYYALYKGHGMFSRFSNLIRSNTGELIDIQAYRDSASSYYIEALGIFNVLGEKKYLQEIFLKYLQMAIVISNIEGGKTTSDDWENWTLKQLQLDCLKADSLEEKKVLFNACISIGTAAEGAWNTLYADVDGLNPFISRFRYPSFREESFRLFNELSGASISSEYQPGAFLHEIFKHRQISINELKELLEDCLKWPYSTFDISTFEIKWDSVAKYKELMTVTDRSVFDKIQGVIEVLKPYASRNEKERTRSLVRSQQLLLEAQQIVTNTTTSYGKTFFSHLISRWLTGISKQLEVINASQSPKLEISPEPCFIKYNDNGNGVIYFLVSNTGDSTTESFKVEVEVDGRKYYVNHESELSAGDCCSEQLMLDDLVISDSISVVFKVIGKYQGKEISPVISEATYEKEPELPLADESQIPWKTSDTPRENVFKGREEKLQTLVNHYLSIDRSTTYILYGLTRTGKSSILDYLCERIKGQHLKEDDSKSVLPFQWDFSKISYRNSKPSDLWANLIETCIYNTLSDDLAQAVDAAYPSRGLPLPKDLSQKDLEIVIDALNKCNIVPLITIDEFSIIIEMLKFGLIDATFIKRLRDMALEGKACFVYAGTYDIKKLPKEKEYGLTGEMNNTTTMHINEIEEKYANELIDACPSIIFDNKAKDYIRALSGCVPYWIQWICKSCGLYAIAHKRCHLGYGEVDYVVKVLTGEIQPGERDSWGVMEEMNFHNNQVDPKNVSEYQLISCIAYLIRESTQIKRGISMDELKRLWDNHKVNETVRRNMVHALSNLEERKVLKQFQDEGREVYRLNVDLFRRWWYVHHRDLDKEFSL